MHESTADLEWLQRVLDESYAGAGTHLRSIFTPERRLAADRLSKILRGVCILHLATVTASGAPIVAPVDGLFFRGRFWFGSAEHSVRFKHIRKRPHVSAAHTRGEDLCVIVHGRAIEIDKSSPHYARFREYNREVYGPDWDRWGYWESSPYAWIEPRRMYAAAMNPALLKPGVE
jgi:uncharacterized pyridoxamine 5'-phosphate oxidase family protein